ncbi:4Fe-4S binding protein [Methanobrevibacter sp. DSM 116169]|uniref:4Fe-4S binding protein n=1 Tax=Methanobrevibacter sp. DSM 116169 TaxID=3242727 RepID=UPI0038FCA42B
MENGSIETAKPLRDVEVDYEIDQNKCKNCKEKPCLNSCPIDAVYIDSKTSKTKIKNTCFGCVLCRNSCPYDAISMKTKLSPPIKENIPKINTKLCKACGACVNACKIGAIHLKSTSDGEAYSEIDEDKCVSCGYCFRECPTDAIKYGPIRPRANDEGELITIDPDKCIGCMTCSRICPAEGAIEVNKTNKLPYINPAYCAKCEECMHSCPATAIDYTSHDDAYSNYSEIKSLKIVSEISDKDMELLSKDLSKLDNIYINIANYLSSKFDEEDIHKDTEFNVTNKIKKDLNLIIGNDIAIGKLEDLFDSYLIDSVIKVNDDLCIGCGACLETCPVDALKLELPSNLIINEDCIHCGRCVATCPVDAIELYDDFYQNRDNEIFYCRKYIHDEREGKFNISNTKCQKCGICVNTCPTKALKLKNNKIDFSENLCIYCRNCELICPVDAININVDLLR